MSADQNSSLRTYLNDHLAGSAGGVRRIRRLARALDHRPEAATLRTLAAEIAQDRDALATLTEHLGFTPSRFKQLAGRLADQAGRLATLGRLWRRTTFDDFIDSELMVLAVRGKLIGWEALHRAFGTSVVGPVDIGAIIARTERHQAVLIDLHRQLAAEVLHPDAG